MSNTHFNASLAMWLSVVMLQDSLSSDSKIAHRWESKSAEKVSCSKSDNLHSSRGTSNSAANIFRICRLNAKYRKADLYLLRRYLCISKKDRLRQ